jgi:ABC-type bacteriocin/lantibiotic exporter with double-glycine peptidase domain
VKLGVRIPLVQQMEAAECGVACLTMVLRHYGHHATLSEVREMCGTSRDGNSAFELVEGARRFGLQARGLSLDLERLARLRVPAILHWDLNHFVVVEALGPGGGARLVDPASGRRRVTAEELDRSFSGVALELVPGPAFIRRSAPALSWRRYVAVLSKAKKTLAIVLVANVAAQGFALLFPAASQLLIDRVIVPKREEWLPPILGVLTAGALLQIALTRVQGLTQGLLDRALNVELTAELGRRLLLAPLPFLSRRSHGDLLNRVRLQASLQELLARAAQALFDLVFVALLAALMLAYDTRLGLIALALLSARLLVAARVRQRGEARAASELAARAREQGVLAEATAAPELVRGLSLERRLIERYASAVEARAAQGVLAQRLQRGLAASLYALGGLMEALILWYGGSRVLAGEMTVGVFAGFLGVRSLIEAPLQAILGLFDSSAVFRGAFERSDDVLAVPAVQRGERSALRVTGRIEAKDLGFRYGSGGEWVLRHVSFCVEPGEHVVILGRSGEGKSTLLKLLAGLLDPTEGRVELDGLSIAEYEPTSLAQHLGVVLQDPLVLAGSVRDSLALRVPDAALPMLQTAAELACFQEVVDRLQGGYEAPLAPAGSNLSGGERQRLALAQALAGAPNVLVLDEATSALDPGTEARVLDNLSRLPASIVSVAHRPSVAGRAGRLLWLEDGAVREIRPQALSVGGVS